MTPEDFRHGMDRESEMSEFRVTGVSIVQVKPDEGCSAADGATSGKAAVEVRVDIRWNDGDRDKLKPQIDHWVLEGKEWRWQWRANGFP